jgi:ABC-type proline/glycine betaine transport system ATPase subunit
MAKYAPNTAFGPTSDSETLYEFGIELVKETPAPAGDVVTEGEPENILGIWTQTWVSRSYSEVEAANKLEERKTIMRTQAESLRIAALGKGFPYKFANDQVLHVQVRSSDRGNISDYRTIAKEVIAGGGTMDFPFRVYENITVVMTAQQVVDMADRTFVQVQQSYAVSWDYKAAIDAALTFEDLPEEPTNFFLPEE